MDKENSAKLKTLIEKKLKELAIEDELGQGSQKIVELDQQSVGRLSRMDALQSQAMAQAQKRRRQVMKQALEYALRRLIDGEFGFCEECGDEIEVDRLMANPIITRCIACIKSL